MSIPTIPAPHIPAKVRKAAYVLLWITAPLAAYSRAKGWIGDLELNLYLAYVTGSGILAASNTPDAE